MDQSVWIIVGIAVLAILIIAAVVISQRRRQSEHLKDHFGHEYERAVEAKGDRSKAEADLLAREKRVEKLNIRPIDPAERKDFIQRWTEVQARFVDEPPRAVAYADALLGEVMKARGYPVSDFEQRTGDISVDHPNVVEHYRAGHDIAIRHERGKASTEDLRQAMIHYRALFDDLIDATPVSDPEVAH